MDVAVIGTGYVGLVAGACLAELGHNVACVDNNTEKIEALNRGEIPIYEPGLEPLVNKNTKAGRLSFTTALPEAVRKSKAVFIAVGTPSGENGEADLSYVEAVAREIAGAIEKHTVVVEKSTVPVQTGDKVAETIRAAGVAPDLFDVVSNPEFLREGSAVKDFLEPDRVVIGTDSERARKVMEELYEPLEAEKIFTDVKSAELIKHASNAFLATKISFINAIANVCEKTGANIEHVAHGMGTDSRIGRSFLNAGIGYGGSCFPKDVAAFVRIAEKNDYNFALLREVENINRHQRKLFLGKIESAIGNPEGKTIAVLGLAFKPNTDDMREAPSVDVIKALQKRGAEIRAYDPAARKTSEAHLNNITHCADPYNAIQNADALVIFTEWDEFSRLDLEKVKRTLKQPIVIDGRNVFSREKMKDLGFTYVSIGR
ncbi:MAG: UDP-glucose/GDP-mannose dehydrogenase family protein [Candidatus Diapherotrites archaeon]|nr:UDP-glucose/GDP-mannose dehydrogenase family protein [Candidatus Micrarchaeota archaeon]MBU1939482.1 UDP-glucose/GDP-mannose dehydrogenase family protein [Candidatus Micrarchaeota archaeon]